ncbi:SDR family NAD(P)-dependent oxidoreductase [Ekhidna sp.]|uniref:SDR family NAD(P)-dependent oxidoreductase n=1 Tax=Ekhidna sp. TaxID=2608089 RepID=UPI003B502876
MTKSKNILITGASTGIGYELVKIFVNNGYNVYGSVRKQSDADKLLTELGERFHPLLFDVTDHEAVEKTGKWLENEIGNEGLSGLINNAGIAVGGPFMDLAVEDYRHQFEVNVFGLIKVTQVFLPLLGARENHPSAPGKIIQISSVSGRMGMPFVSPYVGSKHAVEGITESLRKELLMYGIDVVLIEPGPIKTPIWEKSMEPLFDKFKDSVYLPIMKKSHEKFMGPSIEKALPAGAAAKIIFKEFEKKKSKARRIIIAQKFKNWTLPSLLSTRTLDKILGKALGLIK